MSLRNLRRNVGCKQKTMPNCKKALIINSFNFNKIFYSLFYDIIIGLPGHLDGH